MTIVFLQRSRKVSSTLKNVAAFPRIRSIRFTRWRTISCTWSYYATRWRLWQKGHCTDSQVFMKYLKRNFIRTRALIRFHVSRWICGANFGIPSISSGTKSLRTGWHLQQQQNGTTAPFVAPHPTCALPPLKTAMSHHDQRLRRKPVAPLMRSTWSGKCLRQFSERKFSTQQSCFDPFWCRISKMIYGYWSGGPISHFSNPEQIKRSWLPQVRRLSKN